MESSIHIAGILLKCFITSLKKKKQERRPQYIVKLLEVHGMFCLALFVHSFFYSFVDLENLFWMAGISDTQQWF